MGFTGEIDKVKLSGVQKFVAKYYSEGCYGNKVALPVAAAAVHCVSIVGRVIVSDAATLLFRSCHKGQRI